MGLSGHRKSKVDFDFDINKTTHCSDRWADWEWRMQGDVSNPSILQKDIKIKPLLKPLSNKSVTWKWLQQVMNAGRKIRKNEGNFNVPVLLFQAGQDRFVNLDAEDDFCLASPSNRMVLRFENSRHEVLMENDDIRDSAIKAIKIVLKSKFTPKQIRSKIQIKLPDLQLSDDV